MKRLRQAPAYLINGLTVSVGVACVRVLIATFVGPLAAQLAASGAISTSMADVPNTTRRSLRRVLLGASLSFVAAFLVALLRHQPLLLGLGIALIGGGALLLMAWGAAANNLSFVPILAMIFALAAPADALSPLRSALWAGAGALIYLGWSALTTLWLKRRYRTLAVAQALAASAQELRARADVLETQSALHAGSAVRRAWFAAEVAFADSLQNARDFVYPARDGASFRRNTALLQHVLAVRDLLLTSRLDLHHLGEDNIARAVLGRIAAGVSILAESLDSAATVLRDPARTPILPDAHLGHAAWFDGIAFPTDDPRNALLSSIINRQGHLAREVRGIHALLSGEQQAAGFQREELLQFVTPELWRLSDLRAQLSWDSPVLRHAVRTGVALGTAYFIARTLPWASHPHWLVLSVAVVLRGNLEQTLARRNMRIAGTLLGCVLVVALIAVRSPLLLEACFLLAIGVSHAFAPRRYWLAATAATVMALLQAHLIDPGAGLPIAERAADTLLGAMLAWGFSYILPSWERRRLPQTLAATLDALLRYGVLTLGIGNAPRIVGQRLARRRAYDALNQLAGLLQRTSAEPRNVRVSDVELAQLLDHGQRFMAHLSMVQVILTRRGHELPPTAASLLRDTCATLKSWLGSNGAPPYEASEADVEQDALPLESPNATVHPWLQRRLQLLIREASLSRAAADTALRKAGLAGWMPALVN